MLLPGAGPSSGPGSRGASRPPIMRRRLLLAVLAVLAVLAGAGGVAAIAARGDAQQAVVVRGPDGKLIAQVPLAGDTFAVGYRNSIYRTLAEERYRVLPDGRFELVELAAEQVAVLEEYYAVPGAPRPSPPGDRLPFVVDPDPSRPAVFEQLRIAATDLGERTLFVPGSEPVPIWQRVVTEDPSVILDIEES
ncbi:hypothetical protein [Blastococcus sp. SYSU DS0539]